MQVAAAFVRIPRSLMGLNRSSVAPEARRRDLSGVPRSKKGHQGRGSFGGHPFPLTERDDVLQHKLHTQCDVRVCAQTLHAIEVNIHVRPSLWGIDELADGSEEHAETPDLSRLDLQRFRATF